MEKTTFDVFLKFAVDNIKGSFEHEGYSGYCAYRTIVQALLSNQDNRHAQVLIDTLANEELVFVDERLAELMYNLVCDLAYRYDCSMLQQQYEDYLYESSAWF